MISDRIYDSRFLGSRDILIPVTAVFGCGFDFREVDGLVGIFDVRMYRYFVIFKSHCFKCHERFSGKCRGIKGKGKLYAAVSFFRSETCFCSHSFAIHIERFFGFRIHECSCQLVLFAWDQVFVFHKVCKRQFFFRFCIVCAGSSICCSGFDFREVNSLSFIRNVCVYSNFLVFVSQGFKDNYRFPF